MAAKAESYVSERPLPLWFHDMVINTRENAKNKSWNDLCRVIHSLVGVEKRVASDGSPALPRGLRRGSDAHHYSRLEPSVLRATVPFVVHEYPIKTFTYSIRPISVPTMPLCTICKSIPFRKIIEGDESLPVAQPKDALSTSYHVRSHDSISQLIDSGTLCDLCSIIVRALKSSLWYQHMMRDEDKSRPVWLCLPVGSFSPVIWIYLGQDMPETKIFGKDVKIYAALGESPVLATQ